jgi:hypothetical protein
MNIKLLAIFLLFTSTSYAQTVERLGNKLLMMNKSSNSELKKEAARINTLIFDLQPALYLQSGKQIEYTSSKSPLLVVTDVISLPLLYNGNALYKSAELIYVKVESPEELESLLDVTKISGFKKLKYIHILFSFNPCDDVMGDSCYYNTVAKMVRGIENSAYKVLYEISVIE